MENLQHSIAMAGGPPRARHRSRERPGLSGRDALWAARIRADDHIAGRPGDRRFALLRFGFVCAKDGSPRFPI